MSRCVPAQVPFQADGMEYQFVDQPIVSLEVMEMIFNCSDLTRLKTFRLVCKSWNAEACRIIKKISFVRLCSSSSNVPFKHSRFGALVAKGKELNLLSPFHYVSINACWDEVPKVLRILTETKFLTLRVIIEEMSIWQRGVIVEGINKIYHKFLTYCSASVSELKWGAVDGSVIDRLSSEFPNLKRIELPNLHIVEEGWMSVFTSIINSSPKLNEITTFAYTENMQVLEQCNLKRLKELKIFEIRRTSTFAIANILDIPVLESLELKFMPENFEGPPQDCTILACALISKFSASLRKLSIYNYSSMGTNVIPRLNSAQLPLCPLLTDLQLWWLENFRVGDLALQKFPALKSLCVSPLVLCPASEVIPFHSLEDLTLTGDGYTYSLLPQLGQQFPRASTWEVPPDFLDDLLRAGKEAGAGFSFDKIKSIRIRLSSWYLDDWEDVLPDELPPSVAELLHGNDGGTVQEALCLLASFTGLFYLKSLKHLHIWNCDSSWSQGGRERDISLMPFELIPTLESFSFCWTQHLDPVAFADKLRHLKRVTVLNGCTTSHKDEVDQFFRALPVARCGCKDEPQDWRYFYPT